MKYDLTQKFPYIAIVIVLTLFSIIAGLVKNNLIEPFDKFLLLLLREPNNLNDPLGPVWLEEALAEITALGGYTVLSIVVFAVVCCLIAGKQYKQALFIIIALGCGSLLSTVLKLFFARARPDLVDHLDKVFTSSFPSAHAMVSMFTWLLLANLAGRHFTYATQKNIFMVIALFLSFMIGASRVYLGVHWPSDVLAGWCMGIAWASICMLIWQHYFKKKPNKFV